MTRTHYHVLVGSHGGYMPDENVVCQTLTEARHVACGEAALYRQDYHADGRPMFRVSGNQRDGYEIMPTDASEHTLGYYIAVHECQAACLTDSTEEGY